MRDEEVTAAIREVRERVRARHPRGSFGLEGVAAADMLPLLHARDAAEAKVAAIGTVNPRAPGLKNAVVQWTKRIIARALDWHVREQVEFNRAVMGCVQATLDTLADTNRALAALADHTMEFRRVQRAELAELDQRVHAEMAELDQRVHAEMAELDQRVHAEMAEAGRWHRGEMELLAREAKELKDIREHWGHWRVGFEERRAASEIHMLRTISELQGAFQHRVTLLDESFRKQHDEFEAALDRNTIDVQQRLWDDLQEVRLEFERLIHTELRLIRQRTPAERIATEPWFQQAGPGLQPAAPAISTDRQRPIAIDWMRFAGNFRGSEERIRTLQKAYVARFAGSRDILDLGCGRGEFLEAARDGGLTARGIDQSEECVAFCRAKGLDVSRADLFEYLSALPDSSLGGVYCSQVVEHLEPERLPDLIKLLAKKLWRDAPIAIETPNPECLAIFATHFYLDPTHTRPVPALLLRFYLEEAGFGGIDIERLSPAIETIPALAELPEAVREALFGGLDYAIFARKV